MIGQTPTGTKDGIPLDSNGQKLSPSSYQPPAQVMELFNRVQRDYQVAWAMQHRTFPEFDDLSLLQRARLDQETFGAYVGVQYVAKNKQWRWRGRKNTTRNKLIGILAHLISGMLFPTVFAQDERDEEQQTTATVAKILIEEHLRKADYEVKFMFMIMSALVNPAVFVQVQYVEAFQTIKLRGPDGKPKLITAVDELMSGLNLNVVPIDEMLLADFYTFDLQKQPYLIRVRRIPYDYARQIYAGKYFNKDGTDRFDYVTAGQTKLFMASNENSTLYDVDWTEADRDFVQELTVYYRTEDLQATFVTGVFMGEEDDIYNSNPFEHRRMSFVNNEWASVPIYPFAKSGAEPLDPSGRFAYYKSTAFKAFWDDRTQNKAHQLAIDGMQLDVIKPLFISGLAKADSEVMAPGAVVGMPLNSSVVPYQLGPNLAAAYQAIAKQESDIADSTIAPILEGQLGTRQSALAVNAAIANAKIMLGVTGLLVGDLVKQVGELVMDCITMHETVGQLDASIPGALSMKYKTILAKGQNRGKNVTNKVVFTDRYIGRMMTDAEKLDREWELYESVDGDKTRVYETNPYRFARTKYTLFVDADQIIDRSLGATQARKQQAAAIMLNPAIAQFIDIENVVDDFVIEPYADGDPDRYKAKQPAPNSPGAMMGQLGMNSPPSPGVGGAGNTNAPGPEMGMSTGIPGSAVAPNSMVG